MIWEKERVISAAGVYGAAWTRDNKLVLSSPDGYSISPADRSLPSIIRIGNDRSEKARFIDNYHFLTEEYPEPLEIFDWGSPIGKSKTQDNWQLSLIEGNNNEEKVIIKNIDTQQSQTLKLGRLENFELSFAFSPDDEWIAIVGSGGAEIFKRKVIANKSNKK